MKNMLPQNARIVKELRKFLGDKVPVVGVSGGVDSAVVLALCMDATPSGVVAVSLPYGGQNTDDAYALIQCLNLRAQIESLKEKITPFTVDIKPAVDTLLAPVKERAEALPTKTYTLAKGNVMARVRMCYLYYYANLYGGCVIGTSNKSEMAVGYFTKYGDGGVDVEPIGDLYKSEVYELARHYKLPENILTKAPSACLWEGQTDEGEMGFTYDQLEQVLRGKLKGPIAAKVKQMHKATEHKRRMPQTLGI